MSRPFLYITSSLVLGIFISSFLKIPVYLPIALGISFAFGALIKSRLVRFSHIALYIAVFFLGMARFQFSSELPQEGILSHVRETPVRVALRGIVINDPVERDVVFGTKKRSFILSALSIKDNGLWKRTSGLVKVNDYARGEEFEYGDEVLLDGFISSPVSLKNPGLFNYGDYLKRQGIYVIFRVKEGGITKSMRSASSSSFARFAYKIRHRIRYLIDTYFEKPYNALIKALITGDRSDIGKSVNDDFIKTGTVHILSISGQHIAIMSAILFFLFRAFYVNKRLSLILTLIFMVFYSFIAGSSPPIIRSVIMFAIFVSGYIIGRDSDMLNSLSAAAFIMLIWNPFNLFDPSFQLSFLSLASIVVYAPKIDKVLGLDMRRKDKHPSERFKLYILKSVSISLAAWLGTWPVVAYYFNIISPIAVISNLVIIPFVFLLIAGTLLFLPLSMLHPFFGNVFSQAISLNAEALFYLNHLLSIIPFSHLRIGAPSYTFMVLYYLALAVVTSSGKKLHEFAKRINGKTVITALIALNIIIWPAAIRPGDSALKITFLDVGQGDSAVLNLPGGGVALIDGGSGGHDGAGDMGREIVAPYLWNSGVKKIDIVVASHFHEDHIGGLIYVLDNFKIGCVMDNGEADSKDSLRREYNNLIKKKKIKHVSLEKGDEIALSDGVKIYVLNPRSEENLKDSNDSSLVLKVVYKNSSAIFCGDVSSKAMEHMIAMDGILKSDILKVPHHGGGVGELSIAQKFFKTVNPEFSVISVGRINNYNAPSKKLTGILTDLGSSTYETKHFGAVIFVSNGKEWKRR